MKKKIALTILFVNFLACLILSFYIYFQPEKTTVQAAVLNTPMIPYETLNDYLISSGDSTTHYLFFCDPENADCIYIQNTIIKPLEAKQGQSLFERLEYVDVSSTEDITAAQFVDSWGFSSYPAFVTVEIENGEFTIINSIQNTTDSPISESELKQWLAENQIWSGLFELSDQQVNLP
ncbi:MAG: hypothetical protein ACK5LZ_02870 [Anaerorhabdus sp.]